MKDNMVLLGNSDLSFGARVTDEGLEISLPFYNFFRVRNVVSALGLISFLIATPGSLAKQYSLDPKHIQEFKENVWAALKGNIPDEALAVRHPEERAYGARPMQEEANFMKEHLKKSGKWLSENETETKPVKKYDPNLN